MQRISVMFSKTVYICILSFIVSTVLSSATIPPDIRSRLENASTIEEFLALSPLASSDNASSMQGDFDIRDYASPCDMKEYCTLKPICFPIDVENSHPGSVFIPKCVKLFRCLSSCCDYRNECQFKKEKIHKAILISNGTNSVRHVVVLENHTECYESPKLQRQNSPPRNSFPRKAGSTKPSSTPSGRICPSHYLDLCHDSDSRQTSSDCAQGEAFIEECCSCTEF